VQEGRNEVARARLTEQQVVSLWQKGRAAALERCATTLSRLRAGDGGFYQADDFLQDLFIEFVDLVRRWWAKADAQEVELWEAWQRMLWGGGIRVLRRVPQRLWSGTEWAVEPGRLALDQAYLERNRDPGLCLPKSAIAELTQPETAEMSHERLGTLEELERTLFALRPLQRQVIFMSALEGLPAAEVASCLGLSGRNSVYQRLSAARAALRQKMGRR